jgi:hypothetical protein
VDQLAYVVSTFGQRTYLQGIDQGEIIDTVYGRPEPVLPASAALR